MRVLTPRVHRMLDFATVAAFALAPSLLPLTGTAATLAYGLAVVHLALTLVTRFPGGSGFVELPMHGVIELIVGAALVLVPLVLGWSGAARSFYVAAGLVILAVWALSAYSDDRAVRPADGSVA